MRILLLNHEYPPLAGGAGGAAHNLAGEFAAAGHAVCVLTSACGQLPGSESQAGVEIVRIKALRKHLDRGGLLHMAAYALHAMLKAPAVVKEFSPDVVLAFFGLPAGAVALSLKKRQGVPYVVALRGGDVPGQQPEQLAFFHRVCAPLLRRIWGGARAVAANGPGLARAARLFMPQTHIVEMAGGVDAATFCPGEEGQQNGPTRLLFAGRVNKEKGLDVLLNAVAQIDGDWTLCVAGDGPALPQALQQARRLGILERVEFAGFVDRQDMPELYRQADVLVQPSLYEGVPNSVLEAMASGLAVVASDTPGSASLVRSERTGLVVSRADVEALAAGLRRLVEDKALARTMGRAGRETVTSEYDWATVSEKYLQLF